jgi:hypothetical protein
MMALKEWESFYVIVGSSAGALMGLQFVVMTLIAERPVKPTEALGKALATPTIVHFAAVLLLSSVLSAPWRGVPAFAWGLVGSAGVVYASIVAWRIKAQREYKPEFEDWLFHVLLPFFAYALLAGSAFAARSNLHEALFGVAAAAALLLFDGIHNAWDSVTYHIFTRKPGERTEDPAR